MPSNKIDFERFKATALATEAWEELADALLAATAPLRPSVDEFWRGVRSSEVKSRSRPWDDFSVGVYFMLSAYAIENLLKARIVHLNRANLATELDRGHLPGALKSHDLYELACAARMKGLADEQEVLLQRLTRAAVWYGRYPVPTTSAGMRRIVPSRVVGRRSISLSQYQSWDPDDILRVVGAIKARLTHDRLSGTTTT